MKAGKWTPLEVQAKTLRTSKHEVTANFVEVAANPLNHPQVPQKSKISLSTSPILKPHLPYLFASLNLQYILLICLTKDKKGWSIGIFIMLYLDIP